MKIWWHPRGGGEWMCRVVERAFYPSLQESERIGETGHWSNRRPIQPWAGRVLKAKDNHDFYRGQHNCIYGVRDGRDVALSLYHTKEFQHESWHTLSFNAVLQKPLDWRATPGNRDEANDMSIVEHWYKHVEGWKAHEDVYYLRYENLLLKPEETLHKLGDWLGREPQALPSAEPAGVYASGDFRVSKWRDVYSEDDLAYFHSIVPRDCWALWQGKEV